MDTTKDHDIQLLKLSLKPAPPTLPHTSRVSSTSLHQTEVRTSQQPRPFNLAHPGTVPAPLISASAFLPTSLIHHLLRNKKDSAIGVKFVAHNEPPDAITNMEGVLHTFVTPLVLTDLFGDYVYEHGTHGVRPFAAAGEVRQARKVMMSAAVQIDFETKDVMLAACAVDGKGVLGRDVPADFVLPTVPAKQDPEQRRRYDRLLRAVLVSQLTHARGLPAWSEIQDSIVDVTGAVVILEAYLHDSRATIRHSQSFVRLRNGATLSLEMLLNTAVHQVCNEISALEAACPQGYVYTSDPASIFAREIGATLLNRLQFAALKTFASDNGFVNMKVYAFNDYADTQAVSLVKQALRSQPHIMVVSKSALFDFTATARQSLEKFGYYLPLPDTEDAILVIHNNSDGFGQNIQFEGAHGSLDGAIGVNSSAAASLRRDRLDLTTCII